MDLGQTLASILGPEAAPYQGLAMPAPKQAPEGPGKGRIIAAILADALRGATGQQAVFGPMLGQQRDEQANWHRRRQAELEDYEAKQRIQHQYPDPSPMERDVAAWGRMGPDQRKAYQEVRSITNPEPDVAVTLPNGQFYAGPRSGLAAALMGNQAPQKPIGKLTPMNGGPASQAPGGFPRSF